MQCTSSPLELTLNQGTNHGMFLIPGGMSPQELPVLASCISCSGKKFFGLLAGRLLQVKVQPQDFDLPRPYERSQRSSPPP